MSKPTPKEQEYKIVIDKELLYEALLLPNQQVTDEHLVEFKKVHEVIMVKYYAKWLAMGDEYIDELYYQCLSCILTRKKHYNPKFSAYNFIFTMFRNETGNYIKKYFKNEDPPETDSQEYRNAIYDEQEEIGVGEEFKVLERYEPYLTGAVDYTYIRLPKNIIIDLCTTLMTFHKKAILKPKKDYDRDALFTLLNNVIK